MIMSNKFRYFLVQCGLPLTEYKKNVFLLCAVLTIGTCQIVPTYATLVGEVRTYHGKKIVQTLGGI